MIQHSWPTKWFPAMTSCLTETELALGVQLLTIITTSDLHICRPVSLLSKPGTDGLLNFLGKINSTVLEVMDKIVADHLSKICL